MIDMIITGVVCLWIGWWARGAVARVIVRQYEEQVAKVIKEQLSKVVHVKVEKEGDNFYVYREDNNEFLVQGKTAVEIKSELERSYPDLTFTVTQDNAKRTGFNECF